MSNGPLLFFGILSVCSAHCQNGIDRLVQKYRAGAIWLDMPHYYKDSERIHYSGLKNEFNVSPNGHIEYEAGIRKYRTGKVIGFVP